ncbi:MAG: response regulator [Candidatus Rokubacteria bacterium]|nr:response regulator [Candidatus Rokubacteria bacterium]
MKSGDDVLHILVIEDDTNLREAIVDALREEGHFVRGTADGIEALAWLDELIPDVVLLDMVMPKATVDGFEFIARLRDYPEDVRRIPLVLVSALGAQLAEAIDRKTATELNIARVLPKPVDLTDLLSITHAVARR